MTMTTRHKADHPDWPALLQRVRGEVTALSEADREWLRARLAVIAEAQTALDKIFREAGGIEACTGCDGACCGCGRHHVTLTNVVAYLLEGEDPPAPDFSRTCPYLGNTGCRLSVARRPYNCITFFCEMLDSRLDGVGRERLRALDSQLRKEYQRVAERYPAASLRGLWIALGWLGDDPLLRASGQVVVK